MSFYKARVDSERCGPELTIRYRCGAAASAATTVVSTAVSHAQSSTIDFSLCLGATASEKIALRTKIKPNNSSGLEKKDEIVANVIWRFLELRGCVPPLPSTPPVFHSGAGAVSPPHRHGAAPDAPGPS